MTIECMAEGCPHLAADGCNYCHQHDEPPGPYANAAVAADDPDGHGGMAVRVARTALSTKPAFAEKRDS